MRPSAGRTPDPFLEDRHHALAERVRSFGERRLRASAHDESQPAARTREIVGALAASGLLPAAVPPPHGTMDLRSLVAVREELAYFSSLADTAFAMQGLGSHGVSRAGTDAQKKRWLPAVAAGDVLAAFAVTEPEAGSDLAGVRTRAVADGPVWRLTGVKTFISNAGIAGMYTVLARSGEEGTRRALSMFLVDAEAPGMVAKPLEPMAPHPLGEVRFDGTPAVLLGAAGDGYKLALSILETFRPSVGAAACGLAARALDEAVRWSQARRQFGRTLAEFQAVQMALADMQVDLLASRLLVRQAAWLHDTGAERIGAEAAAAKLFATEAAQRVVDRSVQIHGGQGVMRGTTVERLYREVRALRIYEGTSEIQKLVVARHLLKESK
ncbi:MAG TPA: acyl-CoA dehydrogenase family protein [Vicinamibacteria bacterium]|nr:acyl-CoA dehydrogenase family protein [Vicinamibacteria bacterium]